MTPPQRAHPPANARRPDSLAIGQWQQQQQREALRTALRALLMTPLMPASHADFAVVRQHAQALREWFAREAGWTLQVERDGARLYKRMADTGDATRGLPGYDRRRYALLCLACAVLERAEPQISLRQLGERLLTLAAEPALAERGWGFTLGTAGERRELVAVCRTLLGLGVLVQVAGDEDGFVRHADPTDAAAAAQHDVLYDVQRRALGGVFAAVRGPSTWPAGEAPDTLEARLQALGADVVAGGTLDSDEARRTAGRHHLARRLLDDPVVYFDTLDPDLRAYAVQQRGPMAARLSEATGLQPEQRAEGIALVDEDGRLTDTVLPGEGTDAHVALLVAGHLASREGVHRDEVIDFVRGCMAQHGRFWRKSAREPEAAPELAALALDRLERLHLITRTGEWLHPRPALSRFAPPLATAPSRPTGTDLFASPHTT
ncbi:TIGR02678 family protein [Sphaerotilus natans]|uniref:TIGR02678 family protein n=1 Tax=Sphaerotilus natans TaxID=34103 RepID=UPI0006898167|nr:TIGR02678 family protein [Sphaerotilus natans]SIS05328.1 TIGR02678 family protein [Sphaerotilus natans]